MALFLLIDCRNQSISSAQVEWLILHLPRLVWRGDPDEDSVDRADHKDAQPIDYKLRPSRPGIRDRCFRFRERLLMFGFPINWSLAGSLFAGIISTPVEFPHVSLTVLDKYGHREDKLEFLFRAVALGLLNPPPHIWLPMYDEIRDPLWQAISDCTNAGQVVRKELCCLLPKVLISYCCFVLQR